MIDMARKIIVLAGLAFLIGCSNESVEQQNPNYRESRHPNGLIVRSSPSTTAEQTPNGYIVRDSPSMKTRYPMEVTIQRLTTASIHEPKLANTKKIVNRSVSYQIDKVGAGSGGTEYRLRVLLVIAGSSILFEQQAQSEPPSEPNFDFCWELVKTTDSIHVK